MAKYRFVKPLSLNCNISPGGRNGKEFKNKNFQLFAGACHAGGHVPGQRFC